jgi:tetratricopeptide (TPR) repeat protein
VPGGMHIGRARAFVLVLSAACAGVLTFSWLSSGAGAQQVRTCPGQSIAVTAAAIDSVSSEVVIVTVVGERLAASPNLALCPGDEVRTGPTGRVAIRFPEKRTLIRLDGNTRTRILAGEAGAGDISLLSGLLHFVSSVRRQFEIDTPYIVAGIEGTEALVAVQPQESLAIAAVKAGVVTAYDRAQGRKAALQVAPGEAAFRSASVAFQKAPIGDLPPRFRSLIVVSSAAVDWAIYYPPILLARDIDDPVIRHAVSLLHSGDYEGASALLDRSRPTRDPKAAALRAVVAVSRNRLDEARRWVDLALEAGPNEASSHIAASYLAQASGDVETALHSAEVAAELAPDHAQVLARLAELQMIRGQRRRALESAERSLMIEPTPLAFFVAGLGALSASRYETAEARFRAAIELDSEAPLPRLGLGLLFIKLGMTSEGSWEIERALAHDPRRAALRNWLGRAYFDEGLADKAREEFALAKQEDPEDPASYLFSALERYAANRPIEALRELQAAEARVAARSVLRSRRGLAEDEATRGAALGRIYDTLGFEQQAIVEASEAVDADPANPGAHRFLAETYRARPGSAIAQTSEILRSQLLSPPSKTPVQPKLAETRLGLLDSLGPARVTFAEFAPLYDADGVRFDLSGTAGTQETWEGEGIATLLAGGISLSTGLYRFETDGVTDNNDVRHEVLDAVSTVSVAPFLDLFGEVRLRDTESGDRRVLFDLEDLSDTGRIDFDRDIYRVGFHATPGPDHDLLALFSYGDLQTRQSEEAFDEIVLTGTDEVIREGQFQYIGQWNRVSLQSGGSVSHVTGEETFTILSPFGDFFEVKDIDADQANAYAYLVFQAAGSLEWTFGLSIDHIAEEANFSRTRVSPKVGLRWIIADGVTLRAAYTSTVKRRLVADQTLEPTAVAGFGQFVDTFNGTEVERLGVGLDAQLAQNFWMGVEATYDEMDAPGDGGSTVEDTRVRGYANLALGDDVSLSLAPSWERLESDIVFVFDEVETIEVPLTASYFNESGLFGSVRGTFVAQEGAEAGIGFSDEFFVLDAAIGYRFPSQRGLFSVEIRNLLDSDFGYVERTLIDDFTAEPRYARDTAVLARLSLRL